MNTSEVLEMLRKEDTLAYVKVQLSMYLGVSTYIPVEKADLIDAIVNEAFSTIDRIA